MNPTETAYNNLTRYIRARYPLLVILSHEERRVLDFVAVAANECKRQVFTWTITQGLKPAAPTTLDIFQDEPTADPLPALQAILRYAENDQPDALFVLRDLHPYLNGDPVIIRLLRDVVAAFETARHSLILLSPDLTIPGDLQKVSALIDWPLPGPEELEKILDQCERELPARIPRHLNGSRTSVIQALQGLTIFEASSVLLSAVLAAGEYSDAMIPHIVREKAQVIRKSGRLEFFDTAVTMADVGGLQNLKRYAAQKRLTFSPDAASYHVTPARGVLLLGVPGVGKSLSAKAIAGGKMPLLRLDVGALMEGLVGASEANTRVALKVAEAVSPCVLWLDEIEKALGGVGGEHDGGTSMRVFGTILTWMQETTASVYVVATANDIKSLRPELIRRFDDVLFVDLPDADDRHEIFSVHLLRRGYNRLESYDLDQVVRATWGYTGAEIEKVVRLALEMVFAERRTLDAEHLLAAARQVIPISETMSEEIKALRAWAKGRAIPAGNPLEAQPVRPQGVRTLD